MKLKKVPTSIKILIFSLLTVLITVGVIQGASVLADPTLEDLVKERNYGTLQVSEEEINKANELSVNSDFSVKYMFVETDVLVDYSLWNDYNEDGTIDMFDVYMQEDCSLKVFANMNNTYLYEYGSDQYYVAPMTNPSTIDGLVTEVTVGLNSNDATLIDSSAYWYDNAHGLLFLKKDVTDAFAGESNVLKTQINIVVENINTVTKDVVVVTTFDDYITEDSATTNARNGAVSGVVPLKVIGSMTNGMQFQFCSYETLGYYSQQNMHVWIAGIEEEVDFSFNEATAILSIDPDISIMNTSVILIYISELNSVDAEQLLLGNGSTAMALDGSWQTTALMQTIKISYTDRLPQIGYWQTLDFSGALRFQRDSTISAVSGYGWSSNNRPACISECTHNGGAAIDWNVVFKHYTKMFDGVEVSTIDSPNFNGFEGPSLSLERYKFKVLHYKCNKCGNDNSTVKGASCTNEKCSGGVYTEATWYHSYLSKGVDTLLSNIYNLKLDYKNGVQSSTYTQALLNSFGELHEKAAVRSFQYMGSRNGKGRDPYCMFSGNCLYDDAGNRKTSFLGGELVAPSKSTESIPLFLGFCSHINLPITGYDGTEYTLGQSAHAPDGYGYRTSAMVVDIAEDHNSMLVIIAPQNVYSPDNNWVQRIVAFKRIPIEYNAKGTIIINKTSEINKEGEYNIAGATYAIYESYADASGDKNRVGAITTTTGGNDESAELPYKTYYVKEIEAATGYLKDPTVYSVTLSSTNQNVVVKTSDNKNLFDKKQCIDVTITVKDLTTKFDTPVPVKGVTFEILSGDTILSSSYYDSDTFQTTSNESGVVKFRVPVADSSGQPITYTIREIATAENYCLDETRDEKGIQIGYNWKDNQGTQRNYVPTENQITIERAPDKSGKDIVVNLEHWEPRQFVNIESHVQDSKQRDSTTAYSMYYHLENGDLKVVDGEFVLSHKDDVYGWPTVPVASQVQTVDAVYTLKAKTRLILGYNDLGKPIIVEPGTELRVCDQAGNLTQWTDKDDGAKINGKAIAYRNADDEKAYVKAQYILYDAGGSLKEKVYQLVNGEYEWEMFRASPGYYINESAKTTRVTNTTWLNLNPSMNLQDSESHIGQIFVLENKTPVVQYRQFAKISGVAKAYTKKDTTTATQYLSIMNNFTAPVPAEFQNTVVQYSTHAYLGNIAFKAGHTAEDDDNTIQFAAETEYTSTRMFKEKKYIKVTAKGNVKNTILIVHPMDYIVGDDSFGSIIPVALPETTTNPATRAPSQAQNPEAKAKTIIGYYMTDDDGRFTIESVGTAAFTNPNTQTDFYNVPQVYQFKDINNYDADLYDSKLPLGSYKISIICKTDGYQIEDYFDTDVVTAEWGGPKTTNPYVVLNRENGKQAAIAEYQEDEPDSRVYIAPDPDWPTPTDPSDPDPYKPDVPQDPYVPHDPDDPYDPDNPDDPDPNKTHQDTEDIPPATLDWVQNHNKDLTYRTLDYNNITTDENGRIHYDFSDTLPLTFAFGVKDEMETSWNVKHEFTFYYEVAQTDYVAGSDEYMRLVKVANNSFAYYDEDFINDNPEFFKNATFGYFRKFSALYDASTAQKRDTTFAFNEASKGWISNDTIRGNATVGGAIVDTPWLNSKMVAFNEATHRGEYHIVVKVDTTNSKNFGGTIVETYNTSVDTLTIKARHLFELD